jgi:hypothetical protein
VLGKIRTAPGVPNDPVEPQFGRGVQILELSDLVNGGLRIKLGKCTGINGGEPYPIYLRRKDISSVGTAGIKLPELTYGGLRVVMSHLTDAL